MTSLGNALLRDEQPVGGLLDHLENASMGDDEASNYSQLAGRRSSHCMRGGKSEPDTAICFFDFDKVGDKNVRDRHGLRDRHNLLAMHGTPPRQVKLPDQGSSSYGNLIIGKRNSASRVRNFVEQRLEITEELLSHARVESAQFEKSRDICGHCWMAATEQAGGGA